MIEVNLKSKIYKNDLILKDIYFKIGKGELVLIVGPSGVGKSTLLSILRGEDFTGVIKKEKDMKIRYISQQLSINKNETPYFAIKEDIRITHTEFEEKEIKKATGRYLKAFDLVRCANRKIKYLSGGEQRRAMIAQRFACDDFHLLLADEPDSSCDLPTSNAILSYMLETARAEKKTMVIVSHLVTNVNQFDKVLILGREENEGSTIKFYDSPNKLRDLYGTDDLCRILQSMENKKVKNKSTENIIEWKQRTSQERKTKKEGIV
ncbi:MAG: ATP-binding cassette domain-containing protein [Lachnospiraceae bacterium]|nr:ATP-binding cassette domain-containing protein [Lachnospiraceae bacterium]